MTQAWDGHEAGEGNKARMEQSFSLIISSSTVYDISWKSYKQTKDTDREG